MKERSDGRAAPGAGGVEDLDVGVSAEVLIVAQTSTVRSSGDDDGLVVLDLVPSTARADVDDVGSWLFCGNPGQHLSALPVVHGRGEDEAELADAGEERDFHPGLLDRRVDVAEDAYGVAERHGVQDLVEDLHCRGLVPGEDGACDRTQVLADRLTLRVEQRVLLLSDGDNGEGGAGTARADGHGACLGARMGIIRGQLDHTDEWQKSLDACMSPFKN